MAEDMGQNFIYLSDEDGNSFQLEHLDTFILDDVFYLACLPTDIDENDPAYGIVILRQSEGEDGELYLEIPEDEEEDRAYEEYMRRLYEDWEDDGDGEEED